MIDPRPKLGFLGKIWTILLGFGPLCLDLGHFAWIWAIFALIWAILQNLGQNRPQRRRSPNDGTGGDGRMYVRTDGQIPPVLGGHREN